MAGKTRKPIGAKWRRVRDLAPEHRQLAHDGARQAAGRWRQARRALEESAIDLSAMDIWLREQNRAFAIETGQIEGLYLLRRGVTETLITEGFEGVRGAHSATAISDKTLEGLLKDQEAALDMLFAHVKEERPLTGSAIKEWHLLLTRHQDTAAGIDGDGNRIEIQLRKGQYKVWPNNPTRADGIVHEYCPPEQVQTEMDQFLAFHDGHEGLALAPELEAAWLHHEFVRIHPFQDGNGRISRLLMAYAYAKAGEFPPVIPAQGKPGYITALEQADGGDFPALVRYLGNLSAQRLDEAAGRAELILDGRTHYRHGNGGVTAGGVYHPPEPEADNGHKGDRVMPTTPLHDAAEANDTARIAELIAQGADPNARDNWDKTSLHHAARHGRTALITTLLELGADVHARDKERRTPLHDAAAWCDDFETISTLLEAGAMLDARDRYAQTALHLAARRNGAVIARLVEAGADPEALDKDDYTPLHNAARWAPAAGITALLELGADAGARDKEGRTPLELARLAGNTAATLVLEAATSPPAAAPVEPPAEPDSSSTPSM